MDDSQRNRYVKALKIAGFFNFEIKELTKTQRTLPSGKVVEVEPVSLHKAFVKQMVKERAQASREAQRAGLSYYQFREMVYDQYLHAEWIADDGNWDMWKMFRALEDDYQTRHPEYPETKGSHHKGAINKGKVAEQKVRYKERQTHLKEMGERRYGSLRQLAPGRFERLDADGKKTGEEVVWNKEIKKWENK